MISRLWRAFLKLCPTARAGLAIALLASLGLAPAAHALGDPPACQSVRLADVGWSDVAATTATLSQVLRDLGYTARTTLLSVPVTFASMRSADIDVFLGNWMPAQSNDRQAYLADHSIEVVRTNLSGAKYTLAVPAYTYAQGLHEFADIARFADALHGTIYGIEAGNDGNHHVLDMIRGNIFGLGGFRLVESSEQGMLAEVARAYAAHQPIVFLAWDPHPMNMRFDLRYLAGGDATFGPNYGGASVLTLARAGYTAACPNVGRLLANLEFTARGESEIMLAMSGEHLTPERAASRWLAAHPRVVNAWLRGVTRLDGRPAGRSAGAARRTGLASGPERWLIEHKIPLGEAVALGIERLKSHGTVAFALLSALISRTVGAAVYVLQSLPPPLLIIGASLGAWLLQRSWWLAAFVAAALLLIANLGYWQATLETLALVFVATSLATAIGVPLGIAAAHRPHWYAALRPVLDLMQTLPTFVYLIPTLVLFGLGVVPALISTIVFALPAPVRLTHLGVSSVPPALLEVGESFGATPLQRLWKIELPSAAPLILAGITQCIMLSLSMVVVGALVGAGGLGVPVVRALNTVQVGIGFEAGLAIIVLAMILDRVLRFKTR